MQEFQVNTSNYSVKDGRSAGGIVKSVTKSGTNGFHGVGYYFDRDSAWAATNSTVTHPVEVSTAPPTYQVLPFKPTDLRRQYGLALRGPILKDKIFFFFAADRFYHDFPAAATITGASANANFYTPADAALPAGKKCGGTGSAAPSYQDANVARSKPIPASPMESYSFTTPALPGFNPASVPCREPATRQSSPKIDWQVNAKTMFRWKRTGCAGPPRPASRPPRQSPTGSQPLVTTMFATIGSSASSTPCSPRHGTTKRATVWPRF